MRKRKLKQMKYKFKNESEDVILGTFADYVDYDQEISNFDKKFVREFSYYNNFDGDHDAIEIVTNEIELAFFVKHVINQYNSYLERKGYTITKSN